MKGREIDEDDVEEHVSLWTHSGLDGMGKADMSR